MQTYTEFMRHLVRHETAYHLNRARLMRRNLVECPQFSEFYRAAIDANLAIARMYKNAGDLDALRSEFFRLFKSSERAYSEYMYAAFHVEDLQRQAFAHKLDLAYVESKSRRHA